MARRIGFDANGGAAIVLLAALLAALPAAEVGALLIEHEPRRGRRVGRIVVGHVPELHRQRLDILNMRGGAGVREAEVQGRVVVVP